MFSVCHTNEYSVYLGSHLCVVLFYFGTFRFRRVATESFTGTEGSEEGGERTADRLASNFCCQLCEAFFEGQFQYCVSELVPLLPPPFPASTHNPFSSQSLSLCARASLGISKMWAHVSRLERLLVVSATKCIENYFFCLLKLFFELYWKRRDVSKGRCGVQAALIALAASCLANCTATYTHWEKSMKGLTVWADEKWRDVSVV